MLRRFFSRHTTGSDGTNWVNSYDFYQKVYQARLLRDLILFDAAYRAGGCLTKLPKLGLFNHVYFSKRGRTPTECEWNEIDQKIEALLAICDQNAILKHRERFFVSTLKRYSNYALWFLLLCVTSLIMATFPIAQIVPMMKSLADWWIYSWYILWLVSLGALGSIAYVTVNALAIHTDATFDIRSNTLIKLRILLGCLSALAVGMPIDRTEFVKFIASNTSSPDYASWLLLLVLPFVLGFSTSFLMAILKRIGDGLQTVFGGSVNEAAGSLPLASTARELISAIPTPPPSTVPLREGERVPGGMT